MLELVDDSLIFSFPEVHAKAKCRIGFQKTLRIPDDNRDYPLPAGLGKFPVEHVEDHKDRLPKDWATHGGVLLPMYQSEAMWINLTSSKDYPFAIKIAAGKINAVTGESWSNGLSNDPQDYVVMPDQPWLDGYCVQKGLIRQFVAMPLGDGYTAEEQITGSGEFGGIQIIAYPMKADVYEKMYSKRPKVFAAYCYSPNVECKELSIEMGLAPGGLMRQEIYDDSYGIDVWDTNTSRRCFVHILNSTQWQTATGKLPPRTPISAHEYEKAGVPWFDYYDDNLKSLKGSKKLSGMDSVETKDIKNGKPPSSENSIGDTGNLGRVNTN